MYDVSKILAGVVVFIGIATLPTTYSLATNLSETKAGHQVIDGDTGCVESSEFMKSEHMKLLNEWREAVVRENQRQYISIDGRTFEISLSNTCIKCHNNKSQFCDRCHSYLGFEPNCWNCHIAPIEEKSK